MVDKFVQYVAISKLNAWEKNARKHSKKQLKQIAASIEEFGFTNPVLLDDENRILAGHGRVEAAKLVGMEKVPCLYIGHLNEEQKRAYVLADNKLALNATWDENLLSDELKALAEIDPAFDIETIGFSIAEIDRLVEGIAPEEEGDPKDDELPSFYGSRCKTGDIWQLGNHRLVCGDSLDECTLSMLMNGDKARMVFTDPPYNVSIDGHVSGSGKHQNFAMASGEMSSQEFTQFLRTTMENLTRCTRDGSIHFICMDWRHMREIMDAGEAVYSELKNLIVWSKDKGGMGTFYRSRHELIFAYKHGDGDHVNSFELGQHGRYRTNVWEYRGANREELSWHPTVKPVQLIADAIKDVSCRGDIVLDLFGGSGSTLIAAEKTGRRGYLCEIDPAYCDLIVARYESYAKDEAILLACGMKELGDQG